jgi:hypothetical protein
MMEKSGFLYNKKWDSFEIQVQKETKRSVY